jgi:hypothetical protein
MFSFFKRFFKVGFIAAALLAIVGFAAVIVAGPHRTKAVVSQVQGAVLETIDECIDDPAALRAQLQEMEREYPKRIAQVRGDLAELNEQIRQLHRERDIALRVVALAEEDLVELDTSMNEAAAMVESGKTRLVSVTFDNREYSMARASARAQQIENTRVAYANRANDAEHDLGYLTQQAERLDELMLQLEKERAQFRTQISALSRQVDAIARNERLIKLIEKRNRTIQECSRYEAVSLDQITGRLAEIRSRQEAELNLLASTQEQDDYEDLARLQLANEKLHGKPLEIDIRAEEAETPYQTALNN